MSDPIPAAKKRDTRGAILDATIRLIGRDGAAGFSASALAAEAGVSKATLFHHFRSLDDVPLEAFDRLAQGAVAALPQAESLDAALAAIADNAFGLIAGHRDFFRAWFSFLARGLHDPRLGARVRASLEQGEAAYAEYLAPHAGDGAGRLAGLVVGCLDGLAMQCLITGDDAEAAERWRMMARALVKETQA